MKGVGRRLRSPTRGWAVAAELCDAPDFREINMHDMEALADVAKSNPLTMPTLFGKFCLGSDRIGLYLESGWPFGLDAELHRTTF